MVVCAYNAADTLTECLASLERLQYENFETIVVNDGSTDRTGSIAKTFANFRLIEVENGGLSAARNVGLADSRADVVAYIDADVRVDPEWLRHLIQPFENREVVAVGGPNVGPSDDPWFAQCVARSPGSPTHVLFGNGTAEHVPGCNMAIRRDALIAIGGFDPTFVRAGDDVDVCWRLQARGGTIAFAPSARVWHRHRASLTAFWRQQVGYGEGEAWLMPRHPDKFNNWRVRWRGRIYSELPSIQALYSPAEWSRFFGAPANAWVLHTARWQVSATACAAGGGLLVAFGAGWAGTAALAFGSSALVLTLADCIRHAASTDVAALAASTGRYPKTSAALAKVIIAALHFVQPLARRIGWVRGALSRPRIKTTQMLPQQSEPGGAQ